MGRVLVVDDEHSIRLMVRLALQHVGHHVETAGDGPEGLERFGDGSGWDLVLLDQRMPGMEGVEVLTEMRARAPGARVVMITAFGTVDLALTSMRLGARDLLRKPFTMETLRGVVASVLAAPDADEGPEAVGPVTVNGFRVVERAPTCERAGADGRCAIRREFRVRTPAGDTVPCVVEIAPPVVDEVRAHCPSRSAVPSHLWDALCEEVLANHVWQNADLPAERFILADELTAGMRRWADESGAEEGAANA